MHGTILVTGASTGIGAAVARRFVASGWHVIAMARRTERLEELAAGSDRILPLPLDVRNESAVRQAVQNLPATFSPVDVLVNNAGLALGLGPAQSASPVDWDTMVDTNCKGLLYMTHAVLAEMIRRGRGHVINIGSVAGTYPYPGANVYGATKAFVHQFSLNLRSDLHGTAVRVTNIEPGMCGDTEFSQVRFKGDSSLAAKVYEGMHALSPDDVAASVEWAVQQPPHVNINTIELMPVAQSFAAFQTHRVTT